MKRQYARTESKDQGYFRYGQNIEYDDMAFRLDRDPYVILLCHGIVHEAIGKGFDVEIDNEVIENNNEVQKEMQLHLADIIEGIKFERAHGDGLVIMFQDNDMIKFYGAEPKNFDVGYDNTGRYSQAVLTRKIRTITIQENTDEDKDKAYAVEDIDKYTIHNPDDSFHVLTRKTEITGVGRSYVSPVFDDCFGYSVLSENATYFVIRNIGGRDMLFLPSEIYNDDTQLANWKATIGRRSAPNSVIISEYDSENPMIKPSMENVNHAQTFNIEDFVKLYRQRISAYTKLPESRLVGLVPGQLSSGETNQAEYIDTLQEIQDRYYPLILWAYQAANEVKTWWAEGTEIKLVPKVRRSLTDIEKADLANKQLDAIQKGESLHMKKENIETIAGVVYEIDKAKKEEARQFMSENLNSDEKPNEEEKKEDNNND